MNGLDALKQVEKVRQRKLERAEKNLILSRSKLKQLDQKISDAKTNMTEFEGSLNGLHDDLFDSYQGKPMDIHDRFNYLMSNYKISSRHADFEEEFHEAEKEFQLGKEQVEQDESALAKAKFDFEKIIAMKEEMLEDQLHDIVIAEEDELDEFLRSSRPY